jgi:hypothetical protein
LFAASEFTEPQAKKSLHLAFLFCRCRVVCLRRLRIKREVMVGLTIGYDQLVSYDKMDTFT